MSGIGMHWLDQLAAESVRPRRSRQLVAPSDTG